MKSHPWRVQKNTTKLKLHTYVPGANQIPCFLLQFQAEGAIFQKIQEQGFGSHPNQTIQLRTEIKIPPEAVGRIIGRRGAKVINNSL